MGVAANETRALHARSHMALVLKPECVTITDKLSDLVSVSIQVLINS